MQGLLKTILGIFFLLALLAGQTAQAASHVAPSASQAGLAYVVRFEGDVPPEMLALLKGVSKAETLRQSPPDSILLLNSRAEEDRAAFVKVFQSEGRFAAVIAADVDQSATPAVLTYRITPGPRFELRQATLTAVGDDADRAAVLPPPADLGLTVPSPFSAKAVVDAEAKITEILHRGAHPYAKVTDRKVTADFDGHAVAVRWSVNPGPKAAFGPTKFTGLTGIKESYLSGLVPWRQGEPYDADLVDRYRGKLTKLDLFNAVQVAPAAAVDASGEVPIIVTLVERKHRTVKGGVDYKTDEGPGANLGWEHRNLFGGGEKLSVAASASGIEKSGEASFEKPDFISPKELFKARTKVSDEDKKAYKGQSAQATATVRRQFTEAFSAAAGLGYRASHIDEDRSRPWEDDSRYGFVFVPVEATWDTRDNVLDPQKGVSASLSMAPYWGTLVHGPNFIRPELSLANYLRLVETPGVVLATRVAGGANIGADRTEVSPDLRYYAGGAGSIRGYGYQSVGPLRGKTPVGGGSMLTFSTELRFRVTELIGVVPFLDGGTAFENPYPPYNQPLLLGAGLGVRVFTPIGPVRLDVATPVTRRKDIDDIAQFYFSIGQAF